MKDRKKQDEFDIQKLLSISDETAERLQEKGQEMMNLMVYYRCAMMEIETKLRVLNEEFSLKQDRNPINSIKTRLKSYSSIRDKMLHRGATIDPKTIEETLNDIAGVRVICSFKDDVYAIASALLKQDDVKLISEKDYIKNPKDNGYRSLHLIVEIPIFFEHEKHFVKVEIQLRTIAMDFWASLEHQLRYKKDFGFTEEMAKELYECAILSDNLDTRMEALRKAVEIDD